MQTNWTTFLTRWFVYIGLCVLVGNTNAAGKERLTGHSLFGNLTSPYLSFLDDVFYYLDAAGESISVSCRSDTKKLVDLASTGDTNALKIFDASGKASSGILEGAVYFIGFYSECVNTVVKSKDITLQSKYCLINFNVSSSSHQKELPRASWLVLTKSAQPPTIGICIPESCSTEDLQSATNASLHNNLEDIGGNVVVCHTDQTGLFHDPGAVITLCIFLLFFITAVIATVYDFVNERRKCQERIPIIKENAISISMTELCEKEDSKPKTPGLGVSCLLAFSFKSNASKIFTVGKGDGIRAIHGLKFLSMALIILGHTFSFATQYLYFLNPGSMQQAPKDFLSQFLANGTLAVDTFYLISGILVAFVTLKGLEKLNGKLPIIYFYFHRYFRLTPLFMAVVMFCAFLLQYVSTGPNWLHSIEMYDKWCRQNGWINALYLHNFFYTETMCLSHTWYLATDMQMYLVTPLILIPLYKSIRYGLISMGTFLFATIITTAVITAVNHYPAIPYISNIVPSDVVNAYYKNVYIKPYCRIGPYIIGIAVGYFLLNNKELVLKKKIVALLWCLSIGLGLTVIYLMWPANQGILPSNAEAASYSALARTVWAICLGWLMIACFYGYGGFVNSILSWSPFVPLSRLTYCAYLIHPVVMNVYYGSTESAVMFSRSFILYTFLGNICITFILSTFLSMLFESPFVNLEKAILSKKVS
ncbi:nose resistant to fluoxetine protein 6 [Caerostris darwini]|uniref:Nose resistant to fluoxetine protein 6 n=1 Tax=Caerostris darwini TaxID=1538125 RepID=A0AAV4U9G8_9ARAC|nr:nose resistant to fluoxetine protein 6 [Caerostris darwini]